jgi:Flp pilus assembly protein TadD
VSAAYDHYQQGKRHLRSGMPAQATVALEKAKRLEPEKASIREALGIAYFRIARWDAAEAEFRKLLELSPADDYAHFALGRTLQKQGRDAEAAPFVALARCLRRPLPGTAEPPEADRALDQTSSRSATSDA